MPGRRRSRGAPHEAEVDELPSRSPSGVRRSTASTPAAGDDESDVAGRRAASSDVVALGARGCPSAPGPAGRSRANRDHPALGGVEGGRCRQPAGRRRSRSAVIASTPSITSVQAPVDESRRCTSYAAPADHDWTSSIAAVGRHRRRRARPRGRVFVPHHRVVGRVGAERCVVHRAVVLVTRAGSACRQKPAPSGSQPTSTPGCRRSTSARSVPVWTWRGRAARCPRAALATGRRRRARRRRTGSTSRWRWWRRPRRSPGRRARAARRRRRRPTARPARLLRRPARRSIVRTASPRTCAASTTGSSEQRDEALVPRSSDQAAHRARAVGALVLGRHPVPGRRRRRRPPATGRGRGPRRRAVTSTTSSRRRRAVAWTKVGCQPRPMLGRLPWFALERRRRALRFLVFFDIGHDKPTVDRSAVNRADDRSLARPGAPIPGTSIGVGARAPPAPSWTPGNLPSPPVRWPTAVGRWLQRDRYDRTSMDPVASTAVGEAAEHRPPGAPTTGAAARRCRRPRRLVAGSMSSRIGAGRTHRRRRPVDDAGQSAGRMHVAGVQIGRARGTRRRSPMQPGSPIRRSATAARLAWSVGELIGDPPVPPGRSPSGLPHRRPSAMLHHQISSRRCRYASRND